MAQLLCSLHFVLKGSVTNTVGYFICSGFPNNRVLLQSIGCHEASVTPFDLTGRGTLGGEGLALPSNQGVSCWGRWYFSRISIVLLQSAQECDPVMWFIITSWLLYLLTEHHCYMLVFESWTQCDSWLVLSVPPPTVFRYDYSCESKPTDIDQDVISSCSCSLPLRKDCWKTFGS